MFSLDTNSKFYLIFLSDKYPKLDIGTKRDYKLKYSRTTINYK